MILFEGKILNIGTPTKPSSKIETRAFSEVDRVSAATHLKLRDSDKFIEITDGMVIKRKKDSSGNPTDNMTSFAHIKKNEEYVCVIDGAEIAISSCLYAQIVFVKKSERGNLLKCKDGVYVRKDEVQVPAYKKVAEKAPLQVAHDGDYFIQREIVRLPNGTEIVVPDPRVKKEEDKWLFTEDSGRTWKECEAKKEIDSRLYIKYVLVDNKVVNIQKLTEQPNGDYVIKGDIAGTDIIVGKKNPKLERAFVQGSSFVRKTKFFEADNLLEQRGNLNNEKHDIAYRRDEPDSNGLVAVDINRSRTSVMFTYRDASGAERREIYALENANSRSRHRATGAKLIRVRSFKLIETSNGISIEFEQIKPNVAQDVVFRSGKLNSYTMNDRKITHIKWESVDGYDMISSYIIDGTKLSDIEWNAEHKIERCKVHLINDDGREVVKEIDDFANSEYAYLAITYKLTSTLEDVKISDGKLSFTMGDYKFKDAELITGGKIGKCKLIHNGEEEEINLSTDSRFTQLKLAVEVSLDESKITPLIQSELLAKKDDHYVLEADIIQSGEMKEVYDEHGKLIEGGVVDAVKLKSVDHAIDEQQKFKDHPYKTVVIDSQDKNKTHVITDFATTYEDSSQFELNQDVLTDMVGKQKIEVKKGEVSIDSKKTDDRRDSLIVVGFSLGVFGIPLVMAGVAVGVVSPILRAIKKTALENVDIKTCQQDTQKNVANQCRTNIRNLTASFKRELALYKRQYSEKEFMAKAQELEAEFRFKYVQELGKLQLLGGGEIECEFDPSKKVKLHCGNHMVYLAYREKRDELENGAHPKPEFNQEMAKVKEIKSSKEARWIEEVRVCKEFGGAKQQRKAYNIQRMHIDFFLDRENKYREATGEPALSKKDYRKKLKREFNAGKLVWGGIEDKLDAFKQTPEYARADSKQKAELLKDKRESLEKELTKIKIDRVTIKPLTDRKGNLVIDKYTQSAVAHMERTAQMIASGAIDEIEEFDYNYYDKLTPQQKEVYASTILAEGTTKKVNNTSTRRVEYDKKVNAKFVEQTKESQRVIDEKVKDLAEEGKEYRDNRDFESLVKLTIALDIEEEKFITDTERMEQRIANTPYDELNPDATAQAREDLDNSRINYEKQKRLAEGSKKLLEDNYKWQVREWALEDFARKHKTEFAVYKGSILRGKTATLTTEQVLIGFYDRMCENPDKKGSYVMELETYKVKNHIEENIEAEAFCEVNETEYLAFIAERNASSATGSLDPNSEVAKCYFYAHCKKENPRSVSEFKTLSVNKIKEKAKQRLQNKTLVKHEKRKIAERTRTTSRSTEYGVAPETIEVEPVLSA